jgi:hypothetical protein
MRVCAFRAEGRKRMAVVAWIVAIALMTCVACDLAGPGEVP